MRTRLVALAVTGILAGGWVGVADADPGPHHGNNAHGLCTAYFNGQKNGHGKNDRPSPPPFAALEAAAEAEEQTVYEYCSAVEGPGNGAGGDGIGGNPAHGRFPGCFDDDEDTECDA